MVVLITRGVAVSSYEYETTCRNCKQMSGIGVANSVVRLYVRAPWFSYIKFICTACQYENNSFFGPVDWKLEIAFLLEIQVGFITEDDPEPNIVASYEEIYELTPIPEHSLTESQEKEIAFWHYLLERGDMEWEDN